MTARDLVPLPLRSAIKRGAAFDRFADLGEDRARSLFRLGPFTSRRLGNKSESLRVERGTEQNGSGSL